MAVLMTVFVVLVSSVAVLVTIFAMIALFVVVLMTVPMAVITRGPISNVVGWLHDRWTRINGHI